MRQKSRRPKNTSQKVFGECEEQRMLRRQRRQRSSAASAAKPQKHIKHGFLSFSLRDGEGEGLCRATSTVFIHPDPKDPDTFQGKACSRGSTPHCARGSSPRHSSACEVTSLSIAGGARPRFAGSSVRLIPVPDIMPLLSSLFFCLGAVPRVDEERCADISLQLRMCILSRLAWSSFVLLSCVSFVVPVLFPVKVRIHVGWNRRVLGLKYVVGRRVLSASTQFKVVRPPTENRGTHGCAHSPWTASGMVHDGMREGASSLSVSQGGGVIRPITAQL